MILFNDAVSVFDPRQTKEGYVTAFARIARTGIQEYLAKELGITDGDPNRVVRVMRSAKEVFSKDSIKSLAHVPLTMGHPSEPVTAETWADVAVGETGDEVLRDGEYIRTSMMVRDAAAIKSGHKELSAGYTAIIDKAPEGADYDYEQRDIRFNHLAIVPRGRAGKEARIGDSLLWGASPHNIEDKPMTLKAVAFGDAVIEVNPDHAETLIKYKTDAAKQLADAQEALGEAKAKLADAEAKVVSDADIQALVLERATLADTARKIHPTIEIGVKSAVDIKREAVAFKFGDEFVADVSDAEINGMFRLASAKKVEDIALKTIGDVKTVDDYAKRVKDAENKFLFPQGAK